MRKKEGLSNKVEIEQETVLGCKQKAEVRRPVRERKTEGASNEVRE